MYGEREEKAGLCRSVFRTGTEPDREEFAKAMARVIAGLEGGVFREVSRKEDREPEKGEKSADSQGREGI